MRDGPNPAKAHTPVSPSPFSAPGTEPGHDRQKEYGQIHERNGIWVVTIGGIWRGDYTRRENAIAAVKAASLDAW